MSTEKAWFRRQSIDLGSFLLSSQEIKGTASGGKKVAPSQSLPSGLGNYWRLGDSQESREIIYIEMESLELVMQECSFSLREVGPGPSDPTSPPLPPPGSNLAVDEVVSLLFTLLQSDRQLYTYQRARPLQSTIRTVGGSISYSCPCCPQTYLARGMLLCQHIVYRHPEYTVNQLKLNCEINQISGFDFIVKRLKDGSLVTTSIHRRTVQVYPRIVIPKSTCRICCSIV